MTLARSLLAAAALVASLAACGSGPSQPPASAHLAGFHSGECNKVTDDEVTHAARSGMFSRVVVSDAGCFWQENSMIGSFGAGMGISTWWYRGSDMDVERTLETKAGRKLTEMTLSGNEGFQASDANACSIYVAKDDDVITWSIQTLNPASLSDLCTITQQLARLTQDRVN
jgi:predicted small lipoprotein YifL